MFSQPSETRTFFRLFALEYRVPGQTTPVLETAQTSQSSTLYRKYGATIYSRCRRVTGDDQRAAEATVEAFMKALPELINAKSEAEAIAIIYRRCDEVCSRDRFLKCA